jgi:hypothetical protein
MFYSEAAYYEFLEDQQPFDRAAYNLEVYGDQRDLCDDYDSYQFEQAVERVLADPRDIASYADLLATVED